MSGTLVYSAGKAIWSSPEKRFPGSKSARSHSGTARFPGGATSVTASARTLSSEAATEAGEWVRRRPAESLYEVLKVKETASLTEIKTAYRSLAKVYHPDAASESDGRDFMEIHKAYATLSDPTARTLYDLSLGARRRRVIVGRAGRVYTTRRWETDQCW
ncbi:PREDICTED: chaperone protein dnaJ 11, chloroplastic [Tarenaya hassleriana]|uniref:chaperone protein dnaJ 11, chloroplastic n=1 Tax=Tarenaya hassleriana TaxID=28532 RepID=UPI00053C821B|nr:PREDICTED: chaperone protein dnaJ 11, chloroplastic [Tarenaya hassleriana]